MARLRFQEKRNRVPGLILRSCARRKDSLLFQLVQFRDVRSKSKGVPCMQNQTVKVVSSKCV